MSASDEFKNGLTERLNQKQQAKQLILWDGLIDKLIELLVGLFDQCIGNLSNAQVAARMAKPSNLDRVRFRTRVRKNLYDDSKQFKDQGGASVADSVFETTQAMGKDKCEALVKETTDGDNWWPADDLVMA